MNNKFSYLASSLAIVVAVFALVVSLNQSANIGGVTTEDLVASSHTYTRGVASSTASKLLSGNTARSGLEIQNTGATIVRAFLVSTSTGITSSTGAYLVASGGSYTPEFVWFGEIWVITNDSAASTATSSVEVIETFSR